MSGLSQLLGNPNPLQALLSQPQYANVAAPAAPAFDLQPLQGLEGPGAGGPLGMLAAALSGGGPSGPSPMDEVPSASYADHIAEAGPDSGTATTEEIASGLGPDLQQSLGLGLGPSATAVDGDVGASSTPSGYTLGRLPMTPPQSPLLDEQSLYPSTKRSVLQGVIPGIAALFAGLAGGKSAAAGLLTGANAGNQSYNQELKERGALKYQRAQQQYAREVALYNQQWTQAKDRATMISDLAKKAAEFDDPDVAKQWLLSQRKLVAPFGIDAMDAMPGGIIPGAQQKIQTAATKVYNDAIEQIRKNNPGDSFDIAAINAGHTIQFRGKWMTLGELASLGNVAKPVPGAPTGVTSAKTDANAIFEDLVDGVRGTGREPTALERAAFRLQALEEHAKASKVPDTALDLQIKQARLAVLQQQRAKLQAGGTDDGITKLNPGQIRYGMNVQNRYEKASQPFSLRAQAYDTINSLASGKQTSETDIAMVFSWMKMLDPTSTVREGEQAQVRNARGVPDGVRVLYNNLVSNQGLSLTKKQTLEIVGGAHRLYSSLAKGQAQLYENAKKQLDTYRIAPGLFLTPQGSVNDTSAYRTLDIPDAMRQIPGGTVPSAAPTEKPKAAPASGARIANPARVTATAPTPKTVPQNTVVRDKKGQLYQVVGTNPDGTLKTKPLGQYF
jgi:hypothetical protein